MNVILILKFDFLDTLNGGEPRQLQQLIIVWVLVTRALIIIATLMPNFVVTFT